jgi:hypothetical protein
VTAATDLDAAALDAANLDATNPDAADLSNLVSSPPPLLLPTSI